MRLDSARALKAELKLDLSQTGLAQSFVAMELAGGTPARASKARVTAAVRGGPPAGVALGITPSRKKEGHKLAVRVQRMTPEARHYTAYAAGKAGDEIDIQYVGAISVGKPLAATDYKQRVRPLQPGYSVGHYKITAGTIGGFVRDAKGRLGMLSNNHVLAASNKGKKGDVILQPGAYDGGKRPDDVVARLERFVRIKPASNAVDAAWALIDKSVKIKARYDGKKLRPAIPADEITADSKVWKIGRTTGLTHGLISAIELDNVAVRYGNMVASFDGQIEVVGDQGPFSQGGDSGSFILGTGNAGVGLLFAGSETGGPSGSGMTYASPLETALSLLGLDLVLEG